ncbi:hypothetical protein DEO72_LG10g1130 [Vigna unguiculata]|uniref:Uncharacterized protein n=1 Tax=Vigna unguiculata TaxID=3917 RepID=A0A4D6NDB7_VIGUN|nr:hypothetical protein DEO72_LG10g1130 [Vigna unguiculata]
MQIRVNWRYTLTEEGLPLGIGVRFIVEPEHGTPWFFFNSSDNINIPSSLHVQTRATAAPVEPPRRRTYGAAIADVVAPHGRPRPTSATPFQLHSFLLDNLFFSTPTTPIQPLKHVFAF